MANRNLQGTTAYTIHRLVYLSSSAAWTRTKDILVNSEALYQLSYRGIYCAPIGVFVY